MAEAGWKIRVKDGGLGEFLREMRAEDILELERSIGLEMAEIARDHLEEHRTPEGKQMDPWSPGYEERVRKSGEMRDILLGPERRLHRSMTYNVRPDGIYYGSTMVYAAVHQWGWKDRNIPARPYLGMGEEEKQGIEDILADFTERLEKV